MGRCIFRSRSANRGTLENALREPMFEMLTLGLSQAMAISSLYMSMTRR